VNEDRPVLSVARQPWVCTLYSVDFSPLCCFCNGSFHFSTVDWNASTYFFLARPGALVPCVLPLKRTCGYLTSSILERCPKHCNLHCWSLTARMSLLTQLS